MRRQGAHVLRFPALVAPPAPRVPAARFDTVPLGNKLQIMAIVDPRAMRRLERLVDRYLTTSRFEVCDE